MVEQRAYSSREEMEAAQMSAAALAVRHSLTVPDPLRAAVAHVLHASALELNNGRVLPIELRRASIHLVQAIGQLPPS